ncbi:MAG: P-type conjugative transfer protein TrbG, partial [Alphaproteobacteria bacterium]|nr:P-type conjugative transfer protein TrbG [Alphaproteobacteria bacterium]
GVTVAPPWTPVRVFDDGLKTWIEFPADIAASDMPPLFVRTGEGAELVNYRVQRNRYIVDRVFDVAELRLGRVDPVVVRIERRRPSNAGKASS